MPPTYQVPLLMRQPVALDPTLTSRVPDPEKAEPVGEDPALVVVGEDPLVVVTKVVVVGALPPADVVGALPPEVVVFEEPAPLGRYLTPVAGQSDLDPSGAAGTNFPV